MGKGRSPCCDKNQVKRGPWSPAEDLRLTAFIQKYGHDNWRALPRQAGLLRCGKSCRLRWINYLRPDLKRGNFTEEEVETIMRLHEALGNKWSRIASHLPGRTDNEIKNVWNTHLKKRLANKKNLGSGSDESKLESSITSSSSSPSSSSSSSSSESVFSNKAPNSVLTTVGSEFDTQASQVTIIQKVEHSVKQVCNELVGIAENPNESSTPLSSIESNTLNSSQIVAYKPEKQMGSPFKYLGPYGVNNALQEVDKPNPLLELPLESDYDFWKMLDNIGPIQSNEVQLGQVDASQTPNFGQESVQDAETKKYFHDFENEFGLGATKEANKDQFLQKNNAAEAGMDPHSFDFDAMRRPESDSDLDLGYVQWWSSWPQNPGL